MKPSPGTDSADGAVRALQVGPAVTTQGGMASVIEELCRTPTPGLVSTPYPTWWPGAPLRSLVATLGLVARHFLVAALRRIVMPRRSVTADLELRREVAILTHRPLATVRGLG